MSAQWGPEGEHVLGVTGVDGDPDAVQALCSCGEAMSEPTELVIVIDDKLLNRHLEHVVRATWKTASSWLLRK